MGLLSRLVYHHNRIRGLGVTSLNSAASDEDASSLWKNILPFAVLVVFWCAMPYWGAKWQVRAQPPLTEPCEYTFGDYGYSSTRKSTSGIINGKLCHDYLRAVLCSSSITQQACQRSFRSAILRTTQQLTNGGRSSSAESLPRKLSHLVSSAVGFDGSLCVLLPWLQVANSVET